MASARETAEIFAKIRPSAQELCIENFKRRCCSCEITLAGRKRNLNTTEGNQVVLSYSRQFAYEAFASSPQPLHAPTRANWFGPGSAPAIFEKMAKL